MLDDANYTNTGCILLQLKSKNFTFYGLRQLTPCSLEKFGKALKELHKNGYISGNLGTYDRGTVLSITLQGLWFIHINKHS